MLSQRFRAKLLSSASSQRYRPQQTQHPTNSSSLRSISSFSSMDAPEIGSTFYTTTPTYYSDETNSTLYTTMPTYNSEGSRDRLPSENADSTIHAINDDERRQQRAAELNSSGARPASGMFRRPRERHKCSKKSLYKHVYTNNAIRADSPDESVPIRPGICGSHGEESAALKLSQTSLIQREKHPAKNTILGSTRRIAVSPNKPSITFDGPTYSTLAVDEKERRQQLYHTEEKRHPLSFHRQLPQSEPLLQTPRRSRQAGYSGRIRSRSLPASTALLPERIPSQRHQKSPPYQNNDQKRCHRGNVHGHQCSNCATSKPEIAGRVITEEDQEQQKLPSLFLRSSQKGTDGLPEVNALKKPSVRHKSTSAKHAVGSDGNKCIRLESGFLYAAQPPPDPLSIMVCSKVQQQPQSSGTVGGKTSAPLPGLPDQGNGIRMIAVKEGSVERKMLQTVEKNGTVECHSGRQQVHGTSHGRSIPSKIRERDDRISTSNNESCSDVEEIFPRSMRGDDTTVLCLLKEPISVSTNESVHVSATQRKTWMHSIITLSSSKSGQADSTEENMPTCEKEELPLMCCQHSSREKGQTAIESKQQIFISADSIKIDRQTLLHDVRSSEEHATVDDRTYRRVCSAQMIPMDRLGAKSQRCATVPSQSFLNVAVKYNARRLPNGNTDAHERITLTFCEDEEKSTIQAMEPFISSTKTPVELPSPVTYDEMVTIGTNSIEIKRHVGIHGYDGHSLRELFDNLSTPLYTITESRIYERPYGSHLHISPLYTMFPTTIKKE
uniref:Uncharacterized protein n=3 Tax=Parascaris univalens TaxID=6257 RepID=A0A915A4P5_PARUN